MVVFRSCLPLAFLASVATSAVARCDAPKWATVKTSNGLITGHSSSNSSCVLEFLGIPYAKPPVGELRFAPPQQVTKTDHYEAANFGYDCPLTPNKKVDYPGMTPQAQQIISYFASAAGNPQSEDCLTLNIWSKVTPRFLSAEKPVFVFFHGGRKYLDRTTRTIQIDLHTNRLFHWRQQHAVL
jgi:cholinesterase